MLLRLLHNYPETLPTVHNNASASQKKPSRDAEKDTRTQKTGFSGNRARLWHTAGWLFTDSKGVFTARRTGSFIVRKRLFGITGKALPHTRKGFSAQEKSVRRAPEAKKLRISPRILPAQHMLRHFSGAAASPHRVRFFLPHTAIHHA